jgi:hypothetical protein
MRVGLKKSIPSLVVNVEPKEAPWVTGGERFPAWLVLEKKWKIEKTKTKTKKTSNNPAAHKRE